MGFRFQKRISTPFGRVNFSKSGVSLTEGVRGAHITLSKRGVRTSVGIPGSGLSWSEQARWPARVSPAGGAVTLVARGVAWLVGVAIGLSILALIASYGG